MIPDRRQHTAAAAAAAVLSIGWFGERDAAKLA